MTNAAQAEAWGGATGRHWAAEAARFDRMNHRFGAHIVATAGPRPGQRVLDVGCGNGALCLAFGERVAPDGEVLGLDLSEPMLAVARHRVAEAGLETVRFEHGDCQVHPLPAGRFDVAVSRFGVMFFDDSAAAFANIRRSLVPGGRFVFACWQDLLRNQWLMVPAGAALAHVPMPDLGGAGGPGPFALADADRTRSLLAEAGYEDVDVKEMIEPMWVAGSVDDAVGFFRQNDFAQTLMAGVDDATAALAWTAVEEALAPYETADGVQLEGSAWLVTATNPADRADPDGAG